MDRRFTVTCHPITNACFTLDTAKTELLSSDHCYRKQIKDISFDLLLEPAYISGFIGYFISFYQRIQFTLKDESDRQIAHGICRKFPYHFFECMTTGFFPTLVSTHNLTNYFQIINT